MAFRELLRISAKSMMIMILVYILLSIAGCMQKLNGGSNNMPFQNLPYDEFLKTEIVNVVKYGARGDGLSDDSSAILRAITVSDENMLLFPSGTYKVSNNITFPANVSLWFVNGAKLSIDSGKTVTINGKIDAGLYQIFSGSGSVSIANGACEYLIPQWWGAVGDGDNDDTSAIQSALNCANGKTKKVFLPPGIYKTTATLNITYATCLIGSGKTTSQIKVTGGGNGISVTRTGDSSLYEGTRLSDFRIYSTITPVVGSGIKISGDRSVDIENVWVGSWYPLGATYNYGFDKGIEIINQPAYYTTINRCALFRNTYGIYVYNGPNEARILENEIWYGNYGVTIDTAHQPKIAFNSIEGYSIAGINLVGCTEPIVENNRFESSGKKSVILGAGTTKAIINGSVGETGLGGESPIQNNSGTEYHRLNEYQYPIGYHNAGWGHAGNISCDLDGYYAKNVNIEALSGNVKLNTRDPEGVVNIKSNAEFGSVSASNPGGGWGRVYGNSFSNSEYFTGLWSAVGGLTFADNVAVAPNGTNTAAKIVSTLEGSYMYTGENAATTIGTLMKFSVWLKGDYAHQGKLYLSIDGVSRTYKFVNIETTWKRFTLYYIADIAGVYNRFFHVVPGHGYTTYMWGVQLTLETTGVVTGTDNSGVSNKTTKLIDTTKNFISSGIDIGGMLEVVATSTAAKGVITGINSTINFNTGTGTEPVAGTVVTGGTSGATGTVVSVVKTSGTFAGGDAVGYIEILPTHKTFQAESITWSGGSASATAYNPNCVLVVSNGFTPCYGSKNNADNGDTYYVCNSANYTPPVYTKTSGISVATSTNNVMTTPNLYSNGFVRANSGIYQNIVVFNPFFEATQARDGIDLLVLNPNANDIYVQFAQFTAGHTITIMNISSTYRVHLNGPTTNKLYPGEVITLYTDGSNMREIVRQTYLNTTANVKFKTVNGAVSALTNQSTISCNMSNGNVFTLSTTEAIGNVQINATGGTAGQTVTFIITDDATGNHVVTFGTNFKPSGTLTGTASKTATVQFVYDGSNWYEVARTTGL